MRKSYFGQDGYLVGTSTGLVAFNSDLLVVDDLPSNYNYVCDGYAYVMQYLDIETESGQLVSLPSRDLRFEPIKVSQ